MAAGCGGRSLPAGDGGPPHDGAGQDAAPLDAPSGDGAVPHDGAMPDGRLDGSAPGDGGLPPDPGLLGCGSEACTTATQLCCIADNGTVGCVPDSAHCAGLERACDEAADCAGGDRCCVPMTARVFPAYRTQCAPDCSTSHGFFFQVCKTSSECPTGVDCLMQRCDAGTVQTCGLLDPNYCR
ncbi:MAG: hypothetical protein HY906_04545 [Deltaproteobacteria bacterium]|nr:hypothetical protein [Deltaproteobacteria bacterium]